MKTSKAKQVIAYLKSGKSLTPLECWRKFGVYRLSVVINRYRNKYGYNSIKTSEVKINGETFARYEIP